MIMHSHHHRDSSSNLAAKAVEAVDVVVDGLVATGSAALIVFVYLKERERHGQFEAAAFIHTATTYGDFSAQFDFALGAVQPDRGLGRKYHP
jgi:hypothetical protein